MGGWGPRHQANPLTPFNISPSTYLLQHIYYLWKRLELSFCFSRGSLTSTKWNNCYILLNIRANERKKKLNNNVHRSTVAEFSKKAPSDH